MGAATYAQTVFLAGEWAPRMHGRFDDPRYRMALAKMLNYVTTEQGACVRRSGFVDGGYTKNGARARVIDWRFNTSSPYVSEFTDGFMRLWQNGKPAYSETTSIDNISNANPAVLTFAVDGFSIDWNATDDFVFLLDPGSSPGALEMTNRRIRFDPATVIGSPQHVVITDGITGDEIDGSAWPASLGGRIARILTIPAPYSEGELDFIRKVQSSDQASTNNGYTRVAEQKVTFFHPSHAPQTISSLYSIGSDLVAEQFIDGPYLDIPDKQIPLRPNNRNGTITFSLATWDTTITYAAGDVAFFPTNYPYISLQDNNIGNEPPGSGGDEWWVATPLPWDAGTMYGFGSVVSQDNNLFYYYNHTDHSGDNPLDAGSAYWSTTPGVWTTAGSMAGYTCVAGFVFLSPTDNSPYVCINPTPFLAAIDPAFDATNWTKFDLSSAYQTVVQIILGTSVLPGDIGRCIRVYAGPAPYSEVRTYATDDLVLFQGNVFKSLADDNIGNEPDIAPDMWVIEIGKAYWTWGRILAGYGGLTTQALTSWDSTHTYSQGAVVAWGPSAGTGGAPNGAYLSLISSNTNNDPTTSGMSWLKLGGPLVPGPKMVITTIDQTHIYSRGDTVASGGGIYTALYRAGGPGDQPANSHWQLTDLTSEAVSSGFIVQLEGPALPDLGAIYTWRLGLYCQSTGFPSCGTYHEGRLWLSGVVPNRFDAGAPNGGFNFAPTENDGTVTDGSAISYTLNADKQHTVVFLASTDFGLVAGTDNGEWLVSASSLDDPITPTSIQARKKTDFGMYSREPVRVPTALVAIHKFQRRLLEYRIFIDTSSYTQVYNAEDLTQTCTHLSNTGLRQVAYQAEPSTALWAITEDDALLGISYRHDPTLKYVAPHSMLHGDPSRRFSDVAVQLDSSGVNELVYCATFAVDAEADDPTAPVTGSYRIETMVPLWDPETPPYSTLYMDGAVLPADPVDNGDGTFTCAGLQDLTTAYPGNPNSQVYLVLAGCWVAGPLDVAANGTITFTPADYPGQMPLIYRDHPVDEDPLGIYGYVGVPFVSQGSILRPIDGGQNGPAFGKTRRNHYAAFQVVGTREFSIGTSFSNLKPMRLTLPTPSQMPVTQALVDVGALGSELIFGFTEGVFRQPLTNDYNFDGMICWQQNTPLPGNILVVGGFLDVMDV